jgi:hypothetical protein
MRIEIDREKLGQIARALQGGGALSAYQAGVSGEIGGKFVSPIAAARAGLKNFPVREGS